MIDIKKFYNEEYEKCVLGAMLLNNECIDSVQSVLNKEDFFNQTYQAIFEGIVNDYREYDRCEILTLCTRLRGINVSYVSDLTTSVPTASNVDFYVQQILDYSKKRQQREILATQLSKLDAGDDIDTNIQETDSALTNLMKHETRKTIDMKSLVPSVLEVMQKNFEKKTKWLGFDTGWENLNDTIEGLREGKLIVIGARPSMGKSAFALQLAANLCKNDISTSIFSFEMDYQEIGFRLFSIESGVRISMIEHGFAFQSQALTAKLNTAFNRIYNYPLDITDEPLRSEKELFSMIRVQAKRDGKKVFIVDHLGLIHHSDMSMKRYEQVGDITIRLHHLAKELNVCIVVLCQLKRDAEGKKPSLSDLRESGDIEQNADVIMFIHRERAQGGETEIPTEILVEKNRGGSTGVVKMRFIPDQTKFEEVKKEQTADAASFVPPPQTVATPAKVVNNSPNEFPEFSD